MQAQELNQQRTVTKDKNKEEFAELLTVCMAFSYQVVYIVFVYLHRLSCTTLISFQLALFISNMLTFCSAVQRATASLIKKKRCIHVLKNKNKTYSMTSE